MSDKKDEKDEKIDLGALPLASAADIEAAMPNDEVESLPGEAPVDVVSEDSNEHGNIVQKRVTPVAIRVKVGHRTGVKKGHLVPLVEELRRIALAEMLYAYEFMGRPVIDEHAPFGVVLAMEPAFMVGLLDDLKKLPEIGGSSIFQVQKLGEIDNGDGAGADWGPLFEYRGQPVFNTPEETLALAVEGAFGQLAEYAAAIEAEWEETRTYKGWLTVSWLWDAKPDPAEVN